MTDANIPPITDPRVGPLPELPEEEANDALRDLLKLDIPYPHQPVFLGDSDA